MVSFSLSFSRVETTIHEARGEKKTRGKVRIRGVYRGPLGKTGICWRLALAVLQRFIGATRCVDTSHQTGNRGGNKSEKTVSKGSREPLPPPPERIHVIASFRPVRTYVRTYVLHGMRVARYAPRKQKPAERTRCIYSSGSPHCSLFRPVQPIRLTPSPFRLESTPPTSSSSSFCPPLLPPSRPFLFLFFTTIRRHSFLHCSLATRSLPFANAILPSRFFFLLYPFVASRSQLFFFFFLTSFPLFARNIPSTLRSFRFSLLLSPIFFFRFFGNSTVLFASRAKMFSSVFCEGKVQLHHVYQKSIIERAANDGQASNFH